MTKYSDDMTQWLEECGYTTCFFVAGGNIMHLIESFSKKFRMIPVVHEVAAVIAADYFNETSSDNNYLVKGKAIALVTVGPGVTNTVTAIAGSFIDGRELVLIGGQVKSTDLKEKNQRQRGIQEVDGVEILKSITKSSIRLDRRMGLCQFKEIVNFSGEGRKGPVYIEVCLDVQGSQSSNVDDSAVYEDLNVPSKDEGIPKPVFQAEDLKGFLESSSRPLLLIGGGVSRADKDLIEDIRALGVPMATTWHGADRVSASDPLYAGRPNLFGQRWANIVFQQSDLIVSLGSSLGMQQTGFNVQEFAPLAKVLQVDIDSASMKSRYNKRIVSVHMTVREFVNMMQRSKSVGVLGSHEKLNRWRQFVSIVREKLPLVEEETKSVGGFVNPFSFIEFLSNIAPHELNFIPCSSGGSYTTSMQVFEQKRGNVIVSSRGLGSMGIGLSGGIGAAVANGHLTWVVEGDGGVVQNIQELGTIAQLGLPIKIIVFNNDGYASIRLTQKKYFDGNYVGCDSETGLGLPNLETLSRSYGINYSSIRTPDEISAALNALLDNTCHLIEVWVSPEQGFFPKIESKIQEDGTMTSKPLHIMSPPLASNVESEVLPWLAGGQNE
jgi:acetolactate synthase-1/2/3 large subunit